MMRERVAVTGAAGVVAGVLIPELDAEIVGIDLREQPMSLPTAAWFTGSVADEPLMRRALEGCTAVVHLATGAPDWPGLVETDVDGLQVIGNVAQEAGIRKIVYASTNHVVGMHEKDAERGKVREPYRPDEVARPDSLYAVAKTFGEAYCRMLAETTDLHTSCIRLGTVSELDTFDLPQYSEKVKARLRRTWISHADLVAIFTEELEAPERFRLRFAVSDNEGAYWSRDVLVWDP